MSLAERREAAAGRLKLHEQEVIRLLRGFERAKAAPAPAEASLHAEAGLGA